MLRLLVAIVFAFVGVMAVDSTTYATERVGLGIEFSFANTQLMDASGKIVGGLGLQMKFIRVLPDGPADRAGIRAGDYVTAINSRPLKEMSDEMELFFEFNKPIGSHISVEVLREIKKFDPNTPGLIDPNEYYAPKKFTLVMSDPLLW